MLFILRKIRKSFFLPGKLRTYLAYAAGEIILIVVGILLALQISEWNQGRQDRLKEQVILSSLTHDFKETQTNLLETIEEIKTVRDTIMRILEMTPEDIHKMPLEELNRLIADSFWTPFFEPRLSAYHELVSSGSLQLIRNDRLRAAMALLVEDLEGNQLIVENVLNRSTIIEEPYLVKHFVIPSLYQGYRGIRFPAVSYSFDRNAIHEREFANILASRATWLQDLIENGTISANDLVSILDLIDQARKEG